MNKSDYLKELDPYISSAIKEDIGTGDHTSLACIAPSQKGKAQLIIKDKGILAGIDTAGFIFQKIDTGLKIDINITEGKTVKEGDIAFTVSGSTLSILKAERLVLNCMQHMSGIATQTNQFVQQLKGLKTKILDTRKTTPNCRLLEKWAVTIGGGQTHRFGLYDMILIKDNHIDYCGSIKQAIDAVQKYLKEQKLDLKVEIETRNIEEVKQVLALGRIDRIMLDNFSVDGLKKAVLLINGQYETEASGGITLKNVREYAKAGVDYISTSALVGSAKRLNMSLKAV